MTTSDIISNIENHYALWTRTNDQTKAFSCQLENTDIKIIFSKGRWIFPLPNCPTPAVIENTINIVSSDNGKIQSLFEKYLLKKGSYLCFPNYQHCRFEMRFFLEESQVYKLLQEEDKVYSPYETPRWGLRYECALL